MIEMTIEQRKQLVEVAKTLNEHPEIMPIIHSGSCKNVSALCSSQSVVEAEVTYNQKVTSGVVAATDKVVLYVLPTFTFPTNYASYKPIHTRKELSLSYIVNTVLSKMFGSRVDIDFESKGREKEDESYVEIIGKKLIKRDSRIYVPFAGETYERVWYFYSKTKMDDMMDLFLDNTPSI